MRRKIIFACSAAICLTALGWATSASVGEKKAAPKARCAAVGMYSPEYFLSTPALPAGSVVMAGAPAASTTDEPAAVRRALAGEVGAGVARQQFNRQFVAAQLSVAKAAADARDAALDSALGCYGFAATFVLGRGVSVTPETSLRELLKRARAAAADARTPEREMSAVASIFSRLANGAGVRGVQTLSAGFGASRPPARSGTYCCKGITNSKEPVVDGLNCKAIGSTPQEKNSCQGFAITCTGEVYTPGSGVVEGCTKS